MEPTEYTTEGWYLDANGQPYVEDVTIKGTLVDDTAGNTTPTMPSTPPVNMPSAGNQTPKTPHTR